ncbi:MAG: hypothetical protein LBR71_03855 [Synergistaceae bacterium]|jgi:hypothetical protein|nr:hypothetical protein [Synergistaceae bacterium]
MEKTGSAERDVYAELGVKKVINAAGTYTAYQQCPARFFGQGIVFCRYTL